MIEVKTNKSSIDFVVDHLHDNLMSHLCEVLGSSNVFCASTKIETHTLYRDVVGKKRDYVGKIPKLGGRGSDPNPLLDVYLIYLNCDFLVKTKNVAEVVK